MASKQWTLTRPDGKCWTGETPLKCVMAEVNDRVPASVQLERIYGAVEKSRADDERLCRQTYENTFHKITASIGYDDWHMVWFKALDAIDGAESQPTQAPAATEAPSDAQNPKFTMSEWAAHARKYRWRFDLDEAPADGIATAAPAVGASTLYVEVRECTACQHIDINGHGDNAACNTCDWTGPSPKEDRCPGCDRIGTMTSACTKCGARSTLLGEAHLDIASNSAAPAAVGLSIKQEPKYTVNGHAIVNRASGEEIPADEPVFIFRARDVHAASALDYYQSLVPNSWHANVVYERVRDFRRFAKARPERMKEPDTAATTPTTGGEQ